MQNLVIKIRCVSRKQLFFSCCVVCFSMTPECWGLYALENKDCIPSSGADRLYTVPQVYRLPTRIPQSGGVGNLHKVGIPSSGVQRVKRETTTKNSYNIYDFSINRIYKKLYNMYISVFRWGSRSSWNYFSNVKTKAIACDSRKVNGSQCRQLRRRS